MGDGGYYRYPALNGNRVVFVADDDLWMVAGDGGQARRLTAGQGLMSRPWFSPDGRTLVFLSRDGGDQDLYRMAADGGPLQRLTFIGGVRQPAGFLADGRPLISSGAKAAFPWAVELFAVSPDTGDLMPLNLGPASVLATSAQGARAIGRNTADPATWKRYRGGTAGEIWLDPDGSGHFRRLVQPRGNLTAPMWVGERLFFLSDHEGVGNLYSLDRLGENLRRHTDQDTYYARNAATDGHRIVFHAGGDLYLYDPERDETRLIPVTFQVQRPQRQPRLADAARFLTEYDPHPADARLSVVSRGQVSSLGAFAGPVESLSPGSGVRQRLARHLGPAGQMVAIDDRSGEERLSLLLPGGDVDVLVDQDLGRAVEVAPSPDGTRVALTNHRLELYLIDVVSRRAALVDQSRHGFRISVHTWVETLSDLAWSPDSRYLAYSFPDSPATTAIRVVEAETGTVHQVTRPVREDFAPAWDPKGRYLYFLGERDFLPVEDQLTFDVGFPKGVRPFLVTLTRDVRSPFLATDPAPAPESGDESALRVTIDFDGIEDRVIPFPVRVGRYQQLAALEEKVLWTLFPVREISAEQLAQHPADGTLESWDLSEQKREVLLEGVSDFRLAADRKTLWIRQGARIRRTKAGEKVDESKGDKPGRESGVVDLSRIVVRLDPAREWAQMFREAWRLMRDHYWDAGMAGIDWSAMYQRYAVLLPRIGTRGELSDLLWELQGELGTSHAYEWGGDYRPEPPWPHGSLAADFTWDEARDGWRIVHVVVGDAALDGEDSPLHTPGVNVQAGDVLRAIDGQTAGRGVTPDELLWNKKGREVALTVEGADGERRTVTVKTLAGENRARYRAWVNQNRARVHDRTGGAVGYVHVPDMMHQGFAEFHRGFLAEVVRPGLVIDVRFNGGGELSPLLLEKLARRRRGYAYPRWGEPVGYPYEGPSGPIVAITNEYAGSDGDIFSHVFKMMGLGPLVGHRTWGGVIGINTHLTLVDGSETTQPEFAITFEDVGLGVENYGVDPTIPVDNRPEDYAAGVDAQLERAIDEILRLLAEKPASTPPARPVLSRVVPPLPPRR